MARRYDYFGKTDFAGFLREVIINYDYALVNGTQIWLNWC